MDADMASTSEDKTSLSHREALDAFQALLSETISDDPLLNDLPSHVTLDEVLSQIALEHGQAMTVFVCKDDGERMPIVVEQKATVLDLKKGIRRYITLKQTRENGSYRIGWRYVWRTYWLYFDGQKLTDDGKCVRDYGIRNRSEVVFLKKLKEK